MLSGKGFNLYLPIQRAALPFELPDGME